MRLRSTHHLLAGIAALLLAACGGGGGGGVNRAAAVAGTPTTTSGLPAPHSQCTLSQAREDVLNLFEDYYFFNTYPDQVAKYADVRSRLDSFTSVDALLDELRYQSGIYDRGFSYYRTVEEVDQYFTAGEFYGFGFSVGIADSGAWRLMDVYGGSPADLAGLLRGDTILAVNGTSTASLNLASESTFGPSEVGVQRTLTIRHLDGTTVEVTLSKTTVDLDPVPADKVRVFEAGGRLVGYVYFRTFVEDANALLRQAMVSLTDQAVALGGTGIDDLVLDLRYNGGGLVGTAEVLGSLVVGNANAGNIFFSYEYNDFVTANYGDPNEDVRRFQVEADALEGVENVYYLTDTGTASASELTISGLTPYLTRSVLVGARTYGKPVGQWGLDYCNDSMVLFLVTFRTVNVLGQADYYTGIPADCAAPDDWDHALGDPSEARLDAALAYIESNGSLCTAPVLRAAAQSLAGAPIVELPEPLTGSTLAARFLHAY
ncbi:MAG: S41 family peptidase [Pseudomonadales bacterium]